MGLELDSSADKLALAESYDRLNALFGDQIPRNKAIIAISNLIAKQGRGNFTKEED